MTELLGVLGAALVAAVSAVVPAVNAEAYAVVSAAHVPWMPLVLALALGQTAGKLVLFASARRGAERYAEKLTGSRWATRLTGWLASRRTGGSVVLAAATVGLPPLAVVSVAAGASGLSWRWFTALCVLGRAGRFAAIVLGVAVVI